MRLAQRRQLLCAVGSHRRCRARCGNGVRRDSRHRGRRRHRHPRWWSAPTPLPANGDITRCPGWQRPVARPRLLLRPSGAAWLYLPAQAQPADRTSPARHWLRQRRARARRRQHLTSHLRCRAAGRTGQRHQHPPTRRCNCSAAVLCSLTLYRHLLTCCTPPSFPMPSTPASCRRCMAIRRACGAPPGCGIKHCRFIFPS